MKSLPHAAQQSTLSPVSRTLSSAGHDQMHGFNPSSKNPELQSSRAYLKRHFPTAIQLLTTTSKAPSNQPRPSPKGAVLIARPHIFDFLMCAPPEVVLLYFSALSKSSPGSRLAAVTGRHLTHPQYVLPFSRTPHLYPQLCLEVRMNGTPELEPR
jgi:hypothetical protein